jgi:two-component system phosphate regulon response regulator OmpR
MRMLASLMRAQGRVMSREDLYRAATGRSLQRGSRAVELQILRLRRALGPLGRHLVTVPGAGYRLTVAGLAREE